MIGTMTPSTGRPVQLAVLAAPTTGVVEALAEARRRNDAASQWIITTGAAPVSRRLAAAAA
jgi:hypothetical protein